MTKNRFEPNIELLYHAHHNSKMEWNDKIKLFAIAISFEPQNMQMNYGSVEAVKKLVLRAPT